MDEFALLKSAPCTKCEYEGVYKDRQGNPSLNLSFLMKENQLSIRRDHHSFSISVSTGACQKSVTITSETAPPFSVFWSILTDVLRFESLFDGCFFPIAELRADGRNVADIVRPYILAFYESEERYTAFQLQFSDREYRNLFHAYRRYEKASIIIHPVFLYATYTNGLTVDLRIALLLQVFEPIALKEAENGQIALPKPPFVSYSRRCPQCGKTLTRQQKSPGLRFEDELKAIVDKYGTSIFAGDSKSRILKKAVGTRNTVFHVDIADSQSQKFKPAECGFYVKKFSLLYRSIVFCNLGISDGIVDDTIQKAVSSLNSSFPQYRITASR